jgi:hypothetical protein
MPFVLAQQLVDAGGENGQGGLAFVLLVVLVAESGARCSS